jgi:uncharacterized protein (DUF58 family)
MNRRSGTASAGGGGHQEVTRRRPDPRLPAYLVAGFGALVVAIATARPELAALGTPFLALAALGLREGRRVDIRGEVRLHRERAVEGGLLEGEVHVEWDEDAEVDVVLAGGRGIRPVEPERVTGWALQRGHGPVTLPFSVRARSWGAHDPGYLWARVRRPGSFTVWEHRLAEIPAVRVLPSALRLSRLLKPAEPRAFAGMHVARLRGQGTDFAELRPYQPGDRLRDVSWGTSARMGVPWVRVNHPERTGTVVLLLDSVFGTEEDEALARAARATWAVASMHLKAQDRVGLLARGRTAAWLPPRSGRRARLLLLDELLSVGRAAEDVSRRRLPSRRVLVPADALVVGVTSLQSHTFAPNLIHYRRIGHATVALIVDTSDLLPAVSGRTDAAARRVWFAERMVERRVLERAGIPTALVRGGRGVGGAVLTLRRRMNALLHPTRIVAGGAWSAEAVVQSHVDDHGSGETQEGQTP